MAWKLHNMSELRVDRIAYTREYTFGGGHGNREALTHVTVVRHGTHELWHTHARTCTLAWLGP